MRLLAPVTELLEEAAVVSAVTAGTASESRDRPTRAAEAVAAMEVMVVTGGCPQVATRQGPPDLEAEAVAVTVVTVVTAVTGQVIATETPEAVAAVAAFLPTEGPAGIMTPQRQRCTPVKTERYPAEAAAVARVCSRVGLEAPVPASSSTKRRVTPHDL